MAILHNIRATVGAVPRYNARRAARKVLARIADCQVSQRETLTRLMGLNAESDFFKEHGLTADLTPEGLAERFPISGFETFRPAVERMQQGEHRALLGPENRLLMFCLSSGTTSSSKYIPVTDQFLKDYKRGWNVWGIHMLDDHPAVNSSTIFKMVSDYDRFRTPGGTPCGNISGLVAAMQKRIVRTMFCLPKDVCKIPDYDAKTYANIRIGLADPHVGMLTTANPSTLIQLAKRIGSECESLIRDMHDGKVPPQHRLPRELVGPVGKYLFKKNPKRARELERIVEREGTLLPKHFWPRLSLIAVWTGGSAESYLPTLRKFYGNVPIRDHGLHASEGRMTIPLGDGTPAGVLDTVTHYFEFIPEAEYGSANPTTLQAHELVQGESYFILLTTSSGLTRYDISDVVRCVGFYGTTPMLEFLHKGANISNLTGEKVSESQVVQAVSAVTKSMRVDLEQFTLTPVWGDPPHYRLLVEKTAFQNSGGGDLLAARIESELQKLNCEYEEKRSTGRLDPLVIETLPDGTWAELVRGCHTKVGGSVEQYKHPCLVADLKFRDERLGPIVERLAPSDDQTVRVG